MALAGGPADPLAFLQQLNQGSANLTANVVANARAKKQALNGRAGYSTGAANVASPGGSPASGNLQQYAQSQLEKYGWNQAQWGALQALFNKESGWNPNAVNPSSGAFGISQILPSAHPDVPKNLSGQQQIDWGLNYIKQRYGSPSAAWGHETQDNWY